MRTILNKSSCVRRSVFLSVSVSSRPASYLFFSFRRSLHSSSSSSSSAKRKPVRMCFLGAPGVGKGTFAGHIAPYFNIPTISSGDLVRDEIKKGTAIGKKIKSLNDKGLLVADEIVTEMIRKRLTNSDCSNGFLLDGFPRRTSQASSLNTFTKLDLVLNIRLREEVLIEKACARRVCETCGKGYNVANINIDDIRMPPLLPKIAGKCDKCGGKLIQRADDTEDIVRNRLLVYHKETFPLIEYYTKAGILHDFDVKTGIDDLPKLKTLLDGILR